jgi:hypothetical protein
MVFNEITYTVCVQFAIGHIGMGKPGACVWMKRGPSHDVKNPLLVCLAVLRSKKEENKIFVVAVDYPKLKRGQRCIWVFPWTCVTGAEIREESMITLKEVMDCNDVLKLKPEELNCHLAPDFEFKRKPRRAAKMNIGHRDETPRKSQVEPRSTRKDTDTPGAASPATMEFKCTHVWKAANGKITKCDFACSKIRSFSNHKNRIDHLPGYKKGETKRRVAPKEKKSDKNKSRKKQKLVSKVLRLGVCGVIYATMTAAVGKYGAKRVELRKDCDWTRSRLDGRVYASVKIYNDGAFNERSNWTEFECLGYERVGKEGEEYTYDFGPSVGFSVSVLGVVWEIQLGKVIAKHIKSSHQAVLDEDEFPVLGDLEDYDSGTDSDTNELDSRVSYKMRKQLRDLKGAVDKANSEAKAAREEAVQAKADVKAYKLTAGGVDKSTTALADTQKYALDMVAAVSKGIADCMQALKPGQAEGSSGVPKLSAEALAAFNKAMHP